LPGSSIGAATIVFREFRGLFAQTFLHVLYRLRSQGVTGCAKDSGELLPAMDKTAIAACTCIAVLCGVDYAVFGGAYLDAVIRMIGTFYSHIRQ